MNERNYPCETSEQEMTLLDRWRVIWKRRWLVGKICVGAVVAALGISLIMPKAYEGTATLLPPPESDDLAGLGALMAATGAGGMSHSLTSMLPGMSATPTDLFLAMLKSRVMADDVIKKFNLMELYGVENMQDARKELGANTSITVTKEKAIKITVEATTPRLAADMANFYTSNVDRLNRTLNVSKAGQKRAFIERRIEETQVQLAKAEEALKDFQTQNRTVAVEAQSQAMIEAAAMIQAQIMASEVQLEAMGSYLSPNNPQLVPVRSSLEELRKQLNVMESGKGGTSSARLHPAMIKVPTLALEYGRLLRELKVQETLYMLLMAQYEQAKLTEARDTSTVQVLDPAVPADRKSWPSIRLNVLVAGMMALVIALFLVFILEHHERMKARDIQTLKRDHAEAA